jgi:enoyl-CoA hydratase
MACTIGIAVDGKVRPAGHLGLVPGGGGITFARLVGKVGPGSSFGGMISAQEAYRIGLVNEVVPAADLLTRAEAILRKIAGNAPMAVKFALTAVNKGLETSQDEGMLLEASYFGLCAGTEDKKEGTTAFLEKRPPQFSGR